MLAHCPPAIFRNGTEQEADRSACVSSTSGGGKPLEVSAQLLQTPGIRSQGKAIGVLGYVVERRGSNPDTEVFDARTVSFAVNLRQYEWETGGQDTTLRATFPLSNDLAAPPITGYRILPLFRGSVSSTVAVNQGETYGTMSIEGAMALDDRPYGLSDIVLGVAEQGLSFPLGEDTVTLAPLNIVKRKKAVELYYQLRAENGAPDLRTDIVLHRIVKGEILAVAELTLASKTPMHAGINTVRRDLNIATLVGGDHQLDVTVRDASGKVVAQRTINLLPRCCTTASAATRHRAGIPPRRH